MTSFAQYLAESGSNSGLILELFEAYKTDPSLVPENWREVFDGYATEGSIETGGSIPSAGHATASDDDLRAQALVSAVVEQYRRYGHRHAQVNPVSRGGAGIPRLEDLAELEKALGVLAANSSRKFYSEGELPEPATAREILSTLSRRYCGSIGFEVEHLSSGAARRWWQQKIAARAEHTFNSAERLAALAGLITAEEFEAGLHKRYVGQKRFSLQGAESVIPALQHLREVAPQCGINELVIGMAHRGRLAVLCTIAGKPLEKLFTEFEEKASYVAAGAGDVKYHKGYRSTHTTRAGAQVGVTLLPNPSHLEFVNPVVEGVSRALQDILFSGRRKSVCPVLIHGDAAVIGQGVVFETLNLAQVRGFTTGGTIHVVINNQVGFTTDAYESRSVTYCTDGMKGFEVPVLHVNGEDVEAVLWAMQTAAKYREEFSADVAIDIYCHRKYGHNEGDDPSFTQPVLYAELANKELLSSRYQGQLQSIGVSDATAYQALVDEYRARFASAGDAVKPLTMGDACGLFGTVREPVKVPKVDRETLARLAQVSVQPPEGFSPHVKVKAILEKRLQSVTAGEGIDWGTAENLCYGSLISEGISVRLTGQDAGRGTFSHRHAEITDAQTQRRVLPLTSACADGAAFEVYNSTLSEAAVLGYEFGYSTMAKKSLVLWEAQFGDFANGAQVAIDQFIASSEVKWEQLSGVVLLLPHGYEGQGPEHTSARLERFLQLSADGNWTVCMPSHGAQLFHLLRQQAYSEPRRPLVIMTPKSLLRLPAAANTIKDFTEGSFAPILVDRLKGKRQPRLSIVCSGKVYYDIVAQFNEAERQQFSLIRVEQLYPFPRAELLAAVQDSTVVIVQEEPRNMGAGEYLERELRAAGITVEALVSRQASATPAAGATKRHQKESEYLFAELRAVCNLPKSVSVKAVA